MTPRALFVTIGQTPRTDLVPDIREWLGGRVETQIDEFHFRPAAGQTLKASYASPYTLGRLAEAPSDLADTDLIVMHGMGYTEGMRQTVVGVAKRPVLLARRLVAATVAQLA